MEEANLDHIKSLIYQAHDAGKKWHFHILTPDCKLNTGNKFAFIFESPGQNLTLVHYSDQAEKALGQEVLPLLHGDKVLDSKSADQGYVASSVVNKMVERAKTSNHHKMPWHHHLLFPDCRFNKHSPNFTLLLESSDSDEVLESVTPDEPVNDLKQIEALFYSK